MKKCATHYNSKDYSTVQEFLKLRISKKGEIQSLFPLQYQTRTSMPLLHSAS